MPGAKSTTLIWRVVSTPCVLSWSSMSLDTIPGPQALCKVRREDEEEAAFERGLPRYANLIHQSILHIPQNFYQTGL